MHWTDHSVYGSIYGVDQLIGETVEIIQTKSATYIATIVTEDASSIDQYDQDVPCIIVEPLNDPGVEIWIPVESVQSRKVIMYVD